MTLAVAEALNPNKPKAVGVGQYEPASDAIGIGNKSHVPDCRRRAVWTNRPTQ